MKQLSTDIYMVSSPSIHCTLNFWPLADLNLCVIINQSEKRGISVIVEIAISTVFLSI